MADPHASAAAAALQGQAAANPAASVIGAALGIPLDLLGWACFGGLVALANIEPKQPPREGLRLAGSIALSLIIASGLGGAFAPIAADILVALAAKSGVTLTAGPVTLRAAAILIGFGTAFIPEGMRMIRGRLGATP